MKVRLAAPGWENFTGTFGFQATFTNGVSDNELTPRQIARIGSTTRIVNIETGEQVGPAQAALLLQRTSAPVAAPVVTTDVLKEDEARERAHLLAEQKRQEEADAIALSEAQKKAEEKVDEIVIYSRAELEAIAGNDGIGALRKIAEPLGVRGRAIGDLINEILAAQAKKAVA